MDKSLKLIELPVNNAKKLSDLGTYVFFTPAPLYAATDFPVHIWHQIGDLANLYNNDKPVTSRYMFAAFSHPIFDNIKDKAGNTFWNSMLWAVEPSFWVLLSNVMNSLVFADESRHRLFRCGIQELSIPDPVASSHVDIHALSQVMIYAVGVNGDKSQVGFDDTANNKHKPRLTTFPPNDYMLLFKNKFFNSGGMPDAVSVSLES